MTADLLGMRIHEPSRRDLLKAAVALPMVYATPLRAAPPPAEVITPALVAAATKESQVTWYTSADLQLAEKVGKTFEQKFPGIRARVERAGVATPGAGKMAREMRSRAGMAKLLTRLAFQKSHLYKPVITHADAWL